jgi:hypothetical protein
MNLGVIANKNTDAERKLVGVIGVKGHIKELIKLYRYALSEFHGIAPISCRSTKANRMQTKLLE